MSNIEDYWKSLNHEQQDFYRERQSDPYVKWRKLDDRGTDFPEYPTLNQIADAALKSIINNYFKSLSDNEKKKDIFICLFYLGRDDGNKSAGEILITLTDSRINGLYSTILPSIVVDDDKTLDDCLEDRSIYRFTAIDDAIRMQKALPNIITKEQILNLFNFLANIIWEINWFLINQQPTSFENYQKCSFKDFDEISEWVIKLYLEIKFRASNILKDVTEITVRKNTKISIDDFEETVLAKNPKFDPNSFHL